MTVFRRPNGWAAKYVLDEKQIWVKGGPWETKRQAQEAERRDRDRKLARKSNETCASFAARWVAEWPRPEASTRQLYEDAARRFAQEFGPTRLDEVERVSARAWALGVPRNVSRILGTMYEDARNIGLVQINPFSNLRLPATEKTEEVVPPTPDEFRRLLNACVALGGYAREFRALIQFAAWTGMRSGEIQGFQWDDIEDELITVKRSRKTDGRLGLPKNGKARVIAFLEPARVLDQVPRRDSPFVFHTPQGKPLAKGNLYYHWKAVRDNSGIPLERKHADLPGVRFHDLRHWCATQLLEMGYSPFDVSVQLGHEDGGALVMSRYGHPDRYAALQRMLKGFAPESGSQSGSWGTLSIEGRGN